MVDEGHITPLTPGTLPDHLPEFGALMCTLDVRK